MSGSTSSLDNAMVYNLVVAKKHEPRLHGILRLRRMHCLSAPTSYPEVDRMCGYIRNLSRFLQKS